MTIVFKLAFIFSHFIPPLSEALCFSSSFFKVPPPKYPVCSDWSAHTCLKLAVSHKLCKCGTRWHSVLSLSHGIKGGKLTRRLRSCVSLCGREELLLMWTLTCFIFTISLMCKNLKTLKERKKKESITFLLPAGTAVANAALATWLTLAAWLQWSQSDEKAA